MPLVSVWADHDPQRSSYQDTTVWRAAETVSSDLAVPTAEAAHSLQSKYSSHRKDLKP